jgi:hypothetical protein
LAAWRTGRHSWPGHRRPYADALAGIAADQRLDARRDDLAGLGGSEPTAPRREVSARFKFADIFFHNIFTDLAVGNQIRDAQDNLDQSEQQVRALPNQLSGQIGTVNRQLNARAAERQQLLAL